MLQLRQDPVQQLELAGRSEQIRPAGRRRRSGGRSESGAGDGDGQKRARETERRTVRIGRVRRDSERSEAGTGDGAADGQNRARDIEAANGQNRARETERRVTAKPILNPIDKCSSPKATYTLGIK